MWEVAVSGRDYKLEPLFPLEWGIILFSGRIVLGSPGWLETHKADQTSLEFMVILLQPRRTQKDRKSLNPLPCREERRQ